MTVIQENSPESLGSTAAPKDINMTIATDLPSFLACEVERHSEPNDAWVSCFGVVYDITDYLEEEIHPGGTILLNEYLGRDISHVFFSEKVHIHSVEALETLHLYAIGRVEKGESLAEQPSNKDTAKK